MNTKLSEAIMLGIGTVEHMEIGNINSCALGVALNAVGVPAANRLIALALSGAVRLTLSAKSVNARYQALYYIWPWLEGTIGLRTWSYEIWHRFDNHVSEGLMTIEQLADYVRSVEPECGECNSFQCVCPAKILRCQEVEACVSLGGF